MRYRQTHRPRIALEGTMFSLFWVKVLVGIPLLGVASYRFHRVGNIPLVTLASRMMSIIFSTCENAFTRPASRRGEDTHVVKVLVPTCQMSQVLVFQLAAEGFRPKNSVERPPRPRVATAAEAY